MTSIHVCSLFEILLTVIQNFIFVPVVRRKSEFLIYFIFFYALSRSTVKYVEFEIFWNNVIINISFVCKCFLDVQIISINFLFNLYRFLNCRKIVLINTIVLKYTFVEWNPWRTRNKMKYLSNQFNYRDRVKLNLYFWKQASIWKSMISQNGIE